MNRKNIKKHLCQGLVFIFIFFHVANAFALRDAAWEEYSSAQKKRQVKTHHHMALRWPHLKPLLDKSQELQLAIAGEKDERFYYLSDHAPDRIHRDQGFSEFANFEWTDLDEAALSESSKSYRSNQERIQKLTQEVESHQDWEELKTELQTLKQDAHYQEIISPFRFVPDRVEALLKKDNQI